MITSWVDQRSSWTRIHRNTRKYQDKHVAMGLCKQCPQPAGGTSKLYCDAHHAQRMVNLRRYRAEGKKR